MVAGGVALWNEHRRRREQRESERLAAIRASVADVFKQMFIIQHEIQWLTWHAKHDRAAVNEEMKRSYDKGIHASDPKLLGSLAVLASLDLEMHQRLFKLAKRLYALEGDTARIASRLTRRRSRARAIEELATKEEISDSLWRRLPQEMVRALGSRVSDRHRRGRR
jgi:hypothetical protein